MKAYDRSTARVLREEDVDDTLLAAGEPRAGAAAAASCPVGTIHWLGVVSLARKNFSRSTF
jgi:hypothetical protein